MFLEDSTEIGTVQKKKAFTKHCSLYFRKDYRQERQETLTKIAKMCSSVRVLAHTQIRKVHTGSNHGGRQKKS